MASSRVATKAVDWAKFGQALPAQMQSQFTAIQGTNFRYRAVVSELPAELPKINFDTYKKLLPSLTKVVDEFADKYGKIKVSYPAAEDQQREIAAEEAKWAKLLEKQETAVVESRKAAEEGLNAWKRVPPLNQLTNQEWIYYFPGVRDEIDRLHNVFIGAYSSHHHIYRYYESGNYRMINPNHSTYRTPGFTYL